MTAQHPQGSAVRVVHESVHETTVRLCEPRNRIGSVVSKASSGARCHASRLVPCIEGISGVAQCLEPLVGIKRDRVALQMFAPQEQSRVASQGPGAVSQSRRIGRFSAIQRVVEYGARHLRIVGPRTAVEVVGAHGEPDVVDDADLRVHVNGPSIETLEVVRGKTVASGRPQSA